MIAGKKVQCACETPSMRRRSSWLVDAIMPGNTMGGKQVELVRRGHHA